MQYILTEEDMRRLKAAPPTGHTGMMNYQAAACFVDNVIAYGKSGNLETVMAKLEEISKLMDAPFQVSAEHDWDDFK